MELSENDLHKLYTWIDEVPLSRPKRNIARDFSDGVLVAEIVAHYFPKLVELHNYGPANSVIQKLYNWNTLNEKVLRRLGYELSKADMEAVVQCVPQAVERLLYVLQFKMARHRAKLRDARTNEGGAGQHQHTQHRANSGGTGGFSGAGAIGSARYDAAGPRFGAQLDLHGALYGDNGPTENCTSTTAIDAAAPRRAMAAGRQDGTAAAASTGARATLGPEQGRENRRGKASGHAAGTNGVASASGMMAPAPTSAAATAAAAALAERDETIAELRDTVEILTLKVAKLEQLVRLKDSKILKLQGGGALQQQQPQQQQTQQQQMQTQQMQTQQMQPQQMQTQQMQPPQQQPQVWQQTDPPPLWQQEERQQRRPRR